MTYVERILERLGTGGGACRRCGRRRRSGPPSDVTVRTAAGTRDTFDAVVLATHADDALGLLSDADGRERDALGGFDYSTNRVVLHTDPAVMPRRPAAWASWNVDQADCRIPSDVLTMTYHMNRLQALPGPDQYFVSVNPGRPAGPVADHRGSADAPPAVHVRDARRAGARRGAAGHRRTFYAGAHLGYGFHEDGCRSGFEAASSGSSPIGCDYARGPAADASRQHEVACPRRRVRHRRARPFVYALEHRVHYLALDLDELDGIARRTCIARNGRGLLEIRDGDHLDPPAADLRTAFLEHLRSAGEDPTGWQITLVTNPRVLGYVFNPAQLLPVP